MSGRESKWLIKVFSLLLMTSILMISFRGSAQPQQTEYTDEELKTFIRVARDIMPLQQESQMRMLEEIEDAGLSVERFNMILEAHSMGQEIDITEDEMNAFHNALEAVQEVQSEYEQIIFDAIREEGISPERYLAIFADYQQDPELQMRVNELMEGMEEN